MDMMGKNNRAGTPYFKKHSKELDQQVSKEVFCQFCHLLYAKGLVTGSGGNLSVRVGADFLVTPSGHSLRVITRDSIVTVNIDGKVLDRGTPTMELGMHLGILRARTDIDVVCHVHGCHIIAVSALMKPGPESIPPITPGFVHFAHPLTMIPFMVPGTEGLAKAVMEYFAVSTGNALLLQNHGLVTIGKSFQDVLNIAEEIDEAAKIWLLTSGRAKVIQPDHLREIKNS